MNTLAVEPSCVPLPPSPTPWQVPITSGPGIGLAFWACVMRMIKQPEDHDRLEGSRHGDLTRR